ncbi:MAG: hypothetical protein LUD78_04955 [Clostridiales bacterium]|nr:hypothetical protein [Clostridiales bacterium]
MESGLAPSYFPFLEGKRGGMKYDPNFDPVEFAVHCRIFPQMCEIATGGRLETSLFAAHFRKSKKFKSLLLRQGKGLEL